MENKEKDTKDTPKSKEDGIKIEFTPTSDDKPTLVVKKTAEQVAFDKISDTPKAPTAASINTSVGSFADDAYDPSKEIKQELAENERIHKKLVAEKEEAPITEAEINFDKFQQKQKTSFGVKVDILLRDKKSLLKIWISIFVFLAFLIATQIVYIVFDKKVLDNPTPQGGPGGFSWFASTLMTGYIFSYISMLLPIIPFFFLLTSWIVGINGVHASKTFHYFLWFILLISLVCFIVSTILSSIPLSQYYEWSTNRS